MNPVNLFDSLSWAYGFAGKGVVYRLHWNGKPYIGSSVNLPSRLYWWRQEVIPKDTTVEVLIVCEKEARHEYERKCIALYDTVKNGHNKTESGKAGAVKGHVMTEANKTRLRERRIGFKFTEETKKKMSESAKRRGPHAKETIAKAAASNRGLKRTDESKKLMREAAKGIPKSDAHKAALKAAWVIRKQRQEKDARDVILWAYGVKIGESK